MASSCCFTVLLSVAVGGFGFEWLGLSPELGALVLGTLLAGHARAHELSTSLWGLREFFLVGFFLSIGMAGLPDLGAVLFAVVLVVIVLPLKALLFLVVLPRFGLRARSGFLAALALASYSEFGLIAIHKAVEAGWLQTSLLSTIALTVALSFAVAARLNRIAHTLNERWQTALMVFESARRHPDDEPLSLGVAQVIVVGMGRVGTGAHDYLRAQGARVVGLDSDPGKVEQQLGRGRRVLYADAEDPGFWHRLSLANVEAVLLALPDLEAKEIAARRLRARGHAGLVSATNVFPEEAERIVRAGADTTFNYFNLAGGKFAEHTWPRSTRAVVSERVATRTGRIDSLCRVVNRLRQGRARARPNTCPTRGRAGRGERRNDRGFAVCHAIERVAPAANGAATLRKAVCEPCINDPTGSRLSSRCSRP